MALFVALVSTAVSLFAQTPAESLQSGIRAYRAGQYQEAVAPLTAAAQGFLSSEQMEKYVSSGRLDNLAPFETSLVYLALTQSRAGNEAGAREAVIRLMTAERIAPTYATLPLEGEAGEFASLAARLVPAPPLPVNAQLARSTPATAPPVQMAQAQPAPPPVQVVVAPAVNTTASEAERERYIEQRLAEERAKIEKRFEQRLAEEKLVIQRDADQRIAAVQRAADERVAAERATVLRVAVMPDLMTRRDYLVRLREAEGFVATRDFRRATDTWMGLVRSANAPRDILAEAAIGLYRAGSYREAVDAFRRFGTFARGEEDLRYYNAVALYEIGQYSEAKRELSCALPFIEVTSDVERYRAKIEQAYSRDRRS